MNDITALTEREKFEAWAEKAGELLWGRLKNQRNKSGGYSLQVYTHMWNAWQAANVEMVEALEKAQTERDEFRNRLKLERAILEDADKRVANLEREKVAHESVAMALRDDMRESLTVTVKPPMPYDINVAGEHVDWEKGDHFDRDEVIAALAAAGIQVIEGEEK